MRQTPLILAAIALCAIALPTASHAQVVVLNDTFEDGRTNDVPNTLDAGWFLRFTNANLSLGTGADATIGTGDALVYTANGAVASLITGVMSTSATLGSNINDAVILTLDFHFTGGIANNTAGFRLGLFNSNGTTTTADNSAAPDNDIGYFGTFGTGTTPGVGIYEQANTNTRPGNSLNTAGFTTVGTDATVGINDTTSKHSAEFQIIRLSATDIGLRLYYDGSLVASRNDSSISATSFDSVIINPGIAGVSFNIDNVLVQTAVIPEPSTFAMLLGGFGMLALLRRRLA